MNVLLQWRVTRGLTQAQLAKAANVSSGTIMRLESGKRRATALTVGRLAKALNVSILDLTSLIDGYAQKPAEVADIDDTDDVR